MKKILFLIVFALFLKFSASPKISHAAPAPWGIAINDKTRECAGFWPGDEFTAYQLPEGWKSYFPSYNPETKKNSVITDFGECDFKISEEQKCCRQLGLKYVSENIGKENRTDLRNRKDFYPKQKSDRVRKYAALAIIVLIMVVLVTLIVVFKKKKKENI